MPAGEIIQKRGEAAFRALERTALRAAFAGPASVVALGGGALMGQRALVRRGGIVLWIVRDLGLIAPSLADGSRPLSNNEEELAALYEARKDMYQSAADAVVENNGELGRAVRAACILAAPLLSERYLIINGPNLAILGAREPEIYGEETYEDLQAMLLSHAEARGAGLSFFQSNSEGAIVDAIEAASGRYDGVVLNPGAYTHYSYAIYDSLKALSCPAVEVHISDIQNREAFRAASVTAEACIEQIFGEGFAGYARALDILIASHRGRKI